MFPVMLCRGLISICLAALVLATPLRADDRQIRVILDRQEQAISLYFAMPAEMIPSVFDRSAEGVVGADGTVDLAGLYEGTFDTGDHIFAGVRAQIGGHSAKFESTSLMVHDPANLPAFTTPLDAEISIAICNAPDVVGQMPLSALHAYAGYFAWKVDGSAPVSLSFPKTGRGAIPVLVSEYDNGRRVGISEAVLADGGALTFEPPRPPQFASTRLLIWLIAGVVLTLGLAAVYRRVRDRVS